MESVRLPAGRRYVPTRRRRVERADPPPQVIWITCGNTSNARMRDILRQTFANALLLRQGEPIVEITDAP